MPHVENIVSRLGKKFSLPRAQEFSRMPVFTHDLSVKFFLVLMKFSDADMRTSGHQFYRDIIKKYIALNIYLFTILFLLLLYEINVRLSACPHPVRFASRPLSSNKGPLFHNKAGLFPNNPGLFPNKAGLLRKAAVLCRTTASL